MFPFSEAVERNWGSKKKRVQDFSLFVIEDVLLCLFFMFLLCLLDPCWIHPPHLVEDCSIFCGGSLWGRSNAFAIRPRSKAHLIRLIKKVQGQQTSTLNTLQQLHAQMLHVCNIYIYLATFGLHLCYM